MFTVSKWLFLNYLFQETDEGMNNKINLIVKAEVDVDSKESGDANNEQANYDGMGWIFICSS